MSVLKLAKTIVDESFVPAYRNYRIELIKTVANILRRELKSVTFKDGTTQLIKEPKQ